MALLDAAGRPLTAASTPLTDATYGLGDAMYAFVADWCGANIAAWAASGFTNLDGLPVDFGAGAGVFRYQRFIFRGLTVTLQYSPDSVTWENAVHIDFSPSTNLSNIWGLVGDLVDMAYRLLHGAAESGATITTGGVPYTGEPSMSVIAVGNVKKLIVSLLQFSEPFQLSWYFRKTLNPSTATGEADLIAHFRSTSEAELLALMSADVAITGYRVEDRISAGSTNGRLRTYVGPALTALVGTGGAANTNNIPQAAGCLSWYTDFAGRGERGRSYIPGLAAAFVNDGRLTDPAITAYQTFGSDLAGGNNGDGSGSSAEWQLVLWRQHLTGDTAVDPNPIVSPPGTVPVVYAHPPKTRPPFNPLAAQHGITLAVAQSTIRVQRRRGVGVRIGRR